jgi:hypothetical protein
MTYLIFPPKNCGVQIFTFSHTSFTMPRKGAKRKVSAKASGSKESPITDDMIMSESEFEADDVQEVPALPQQQQLVDSELMYSRSECVLLVASLSSLRVFSLFSNRRMRHSCSSDSESSWEPEDDFTDRKTDPKRSNRARSGAVPKPAPAATSTKRQGRSTRANPITEIATEHVTEAVTHPSSTDSVSTVQTRRCTRSSTRARSAVEFVDSSSNGDLASSSQPALEISALASSMTNSFSSFAVSSNSVNCSTAPVTATSSTQAHTYVAAISSATVSRKHVSRKYKLMHFDEKIFQVQFILYFYIFSALPKYQCTDPRLSNSIVFRVRCSFFILKFIRNVAPIFFLHEIS